MSYQELTDALAFFASSLFHDVQTQALFADSKTFADAIGKRPLAEISTLYLQQKQKPQFNLKAFVATHFELPEESNFASEPYANVDDYIAALWQRLQRSADRPQNDSLLPLAHDYLVPGGRFREIYYWDSYFTALGLVCAGHHHLAVSMLENFLTLQQRIGCIPNGNRAYYHSRSQPPVLVLLFDLIDEHLNAEQRARAIRGLEHEYQFWMEQRVVSLPDGSLLNRYFDSEPAPRPESYREDVDATAHLHGKQQQDFLRSIRAACESGWDFSSRWFADVKDFSTLQTTSIIPVDLNALLYRLELRLSELVDDNERQANYANAAQRRKVALNHYLFDSEKNFYYDYNLTTGHRTPVRSLAAAVPLFVGLADAAQAEAVATALQDEFLQAGGLVTTLTHSAQQWDAPNGWAPLQWFAVTGLQRYGHDALATEVMKRWVQLVQDYYDAHQVVLEKYNVIDRQHRAGGGEYEVQLGFGWTNGVYRAFKELLDQHK